MTSRTRICDGSGHALASSRFTARAGGAAFAHVEEESEEADAGDEEDETEGYADFFA